MSPEIPKNAMDILRGFDEGTTTPPAAGAGAEDAGSLTTRRLSDIQAKPISWLWPGRIARGKLTIIAGNPGLGKSQITASIAAIVTTGGIWPVDGERSTPGDVIFLTAEDDPADTLRPRLEAAGADLQRIHVVDGVVIGYRGDGSRVDKVFSLESDLRALESKLTELGTVAAVFIDPITAYLGRTDSHKNSEVRGVLAPLGEMASRHNAAIMGVSHLNKTGGAQALMRVMGSLAFVAAARATYLVADDLQDKARRLFLPMKNNIGPDSSGLAFRIEGVTVPSQAGPLSTSHVICESEPVSVTADEVMSQSSTQEETTRLTEAVDWLQEVLGSGPISSTTVEERARFAGITKSTLRRAKARLGIESKKSDMEGGWCWTLPSARPKMLINSEDAHQKNVSTFGKFEHLHTQTECQRRARHLNQIFEELGNHGPGRRPADIKPETIQDGMEHAARLEMAGPGTHRNVRN
jgi:hypothetical protein